MSLRTITRSSRRAAFAAAGALVVVAVPAAGQGITYDFRVTSSQGEGDKAREVAAIVGRGRVDGDRARIDLVDVKNGGALASKDGYVVVTGGGQRMLMVNPQEQQYYAFNVDQMMAGMSGALKALGGMVKMEMSGVRLDVADVGDGGKLQGYDTRKLRMTQAFTMSMSMLGRKTTSTTVDTTELWVAPALKQVQNPFLRAGTAVGVDFGNPDFRRQLAAVNEKLSAGALLRSVGRSVSTDEKGKQTVTTSTMEVTNVQRGPIAAAVFEIPKGYEEVPMPFAELAALGDSVDAAKAREASEGAAKGEKAEDKVDAAGVKDAAAEAAKEAGKAKAADEAKKKLGGLLKKKWP
jgi:hypothetical protein